MIRGVILEGLSTTGKTSVLSALKRVHSSSSHAERTMIALSEHYSQILHSDHGVLRSLDQNEHIQLLNQHIAYLEQLYSWIESLGQTKPSNGIFFILERFHLNHRAAFADHSEIEALEQRLMRLNAKCVLLTCLRKLFRSDMLKAEVKPGGPMSWRIIRLQTKLAASLLRIRKGCAHV